MPSPIETLVNYRRTMFALAGNLSLSSEGTYNLALWWKWRDDVTGAELESGVHTYNGTYVRRGDSLFFHTPPGAVPYSPPYAARLDEAILRTSAYGIVAEYERVSAASSARDMAQ
jgi:hypothetical protein